MRFPAALGLLCFLASGTLATAQIRVMAQTDHTDFLLYERVDLLVTVENAGESDLVLNNDEGHSWLSFMVTKHNHLPVHPERKSTFKPINLKAGETKTLRVNLTPLFSFREEGDYNAQAVIDLPGEGEVASDQVPFNVLRGREIWSQNRSVGGSQRSYSLIRFSPAPDKTELYLRVMDSSLNLVYANVGLGPIEAFVDPDVFFDPQGNLHILHLISASTYLYTRTDPQGKVVHQGVFKSFHEIRPRLTKMDDGNIGISGGIEESPETVRDQLSEGQRTGQVMEKKPASIEPELKSSQHDLTPLDPVPPASGTDAAH